MQNNNKIIIKGAREHNLKNIDLEIPREAFIVITGLSGSGKSSLAFDTIYAEGQRRYLESLSVYARQFLNMLEKPEVDLIDGLSPAISIEQKSSSANPRSTVGTVTEIYDYLRLLYAKLGEPYCYNCGARVERQTPEQIVDYLMEKYLEKRITILAPVVKGRKGHYRELFERIAREGFLRARIDGKIVEIVQGLKVDRYKIHDIEIVVDRLIIRPKARFRLSQSIQTALNYGDGTVFISDNKTDKIFNKYLACQRCGTSFPELAPNSFSFNSPYGMCKECNGLGEKTEVDLDLLIPDKNSTINEGGLAPVGKPRKNSYFEQLEKLADKLGFTFDTKFKDMSREQLNGILYGTQEPVKIEYYFNKNKSLFFRYNLIGLTQYVQKTYEKTSSEKVREWAKSFMTTKTCTVCNGGRLRKESLSVKINGLNIAEVGALSIEKAKLFFDNIKFNERQWIVAKPIVKEIRERLEFLLNVGLSYLTLNRSAKTLSGGEAQRIRLSTQIGTQLSGVLYVLDEPSIGLHQYDNIKLIKSLKKLRDLGNTIIVVEHDRETIESSDFIVDLGPGAGEHGGKICVAGFTKDLLSNGVGNSLTIDFLKNKRTIEIRKHQRKGTGKALKILGAEGNNLKNIDVSIPLGTFTCITGVSGSGKSSLINDTLVKILMKKFYNSKVKPLKYRAVEGLEYIDKIIQIDQTPIGRTPRSNPATYTGVFTFIRELFGQMPEAKMLGYKPGRFSFNVKGGRCEECKGNGLKKIEMNFLPDVYVLCEECKGKRYTKETLEVVFKTKSIADVLEMTVEEALEFFEDQPRIKRKLQTLYDVGLGYVKLGQQATTLSGGEAQRVKLARELSKIGTGKTLYVLDEPTTGLHFVDIKILLNALNKLVEKGNTVIVIEHNMDVIKFADHIIDLGPGGGEYGGEIVAVGTPEELANNAKSITGRYLKKELLRFMERK